ncbi:MAG: DUF6247 family protein [Actinomycetota bacterium]|nr:DUF6247 family protein [Actinomycetota bacterium]
MPQVTAGGELFDTPTEPATPRGDLADGRSATTLHLMAATAVQLPYANASPAELREAILPEDVDSFDEQFQAALDAAAQTRRLDKLEAFLEQWRRIARSANHRGHDHWREVLARADYTLRTGEVPPGAASEEEMAALIAARLGR